MKTIILKNLILSSFILTVLLTSCKNTKPKTTYYKEVKSGKILDKATFNRMKKVMVQNLNNFNNSKGQTILKTIFKDSIVSGDSIIKTFEFDIKIDLTKPQGIYTYVNKRLPELSLKTMDGENLELSQLKGKPTLINFWFTTCHPCVDEIPVLNNIQKKYKGRVHFISVTFNTRDQVKKFLKSHYYGFTKIVGAQNFINMLKIRSFPVNVFLDKNGIVKKVENGIPYNMINGKMIMGNGRQFEQYLNTLL